MFRSRFATTSARHAAASLGEKLNPVERAMGALELVFDTWGIVPPDEQQLELAAQGVLQALTAKPWGRDTGMKVVGSDPRTGAVSAVRFTRDGLEVDGCVPYPLVRELIARIIG